MTSRSVPATIRCPRCGAQTPAEMPASACVYFFDCPACGALLEPKPGDCCVFCSYGSAPCPPKQRP
ncbi:MAG: GDCCVxC domain-containing (seleno)protein [Gemmatimonadales bacterium]